MASLRGKKQYTGERAFLAELLYKGAATPLDRELERVGFRFERNTSVLRALRVNTKATKRVPPLMQGLAIYDTEGRLVFMLTPNLEGEGYSRRSYPWVMRSFYRDSDLGLDLPGGHAYVGAEEDLGRAIRGYVLRPKEVASVVLYRRPAREVRKRSGLGLAEETAAARVRAKKRKKKTLVGRRTAR